MLITAKTNEGGDLITGIQKYFYLYSRKNTGLLFCSFICDMQYLPFRPLGNPVGNIKTRVQDSVSCKNSLKAAT